MTKLKTSAAALMLSAAAVFPFAPLGWAQTSERALADTEMEQIFVQPERRANPWRIATT